MGLLIAIVRKRFLMMQRSNAEWKMQLITQAKATATNSVNDLLQVGTDYEADSLITKKLQQRQYKLKLLEEKLDAQMTALKAQVEICNTEIESCDKMIQNHMKTSFSY